MRRDELERDWDIGWFHRESLLSHWRKIRLLLTRAELATACSLVVGLFVIVRVAVGLLVNGSLSHSSPTTRVARLFADTRRGVHFTRTVGDELRRKKGLFQRNSSFTGVADFEIANPRADGFRLEEFRRGPLLIIAEFSHDARGSVPFSALS